jgi:hypothetical protein
MQKNILIILAVLAYYLFNPMIADSQEVQGKVWLDTTHILIGDQVNLNLEIKSMPRTNIVFPELKDSIGKLEIVYVSPIDTQKIGNGYLLKRHYTLTCFDSGVFVVPSLTFLYQKQNISTLSTLATDSLFLRVSTVAVDTTKDIKDIKNIVEFPRSLWDYLPYIVAVLLLAAIVYLAYYLIRKRKRRELPIELRVPPHILALEALKQLDSEKLWQKGQIKEFHIRLSEIVRTYIERRFKIPALEMITSEIISALELNEIAESQLIEKMQKSFEISDLVKFAKFVPLPDEHAFCFKTALEFIERTKPEEIVGETKKED